ncbi:MAG: IS66 family insertion sequence element accessory protein TnpB [Actinomycetales bacterium]|nr:IS66 family insertion sequence element accessory protein TnpB [Actinomycetales bacterium]
MIGLPDSVRILLFAEPTDMRRGFERLTCMVIDAGQDVYSGHLFVFVSKRRDRAKILTFQKGGFVLWYKRLERGRFRVKGCGHGHSEIDATELAMLLDGIDVGSVRRPKHWAPKSSKGRTPKCATTQESGSTT